MMSKVHHCIQQELVVQGLKEPPARKCRCKETISLSRATKMVDAGEAAWIVTSRTRGVADRECELCHGDKDVKNCAACKGVGTVKKPVVWDTYNNEIVRVSRRPADPREKKQSSGLAVKTPRTATIEYKHIIRAYVLGNKEAQKRIEEYGLSILQARIDMGIKPENPVRWEDGGKNDDWGRPV